MSGTKGGAATQNRPSGTTGSGNSSTGPGASGSTGTSGSANTGSDPDTRASDDTRRSGTGALTDAAALRGADREMVGRQVHVERVKVTRVDEDHGFWIDTGGANIFVLPVDRKQMSASTGQTVTVDGIILEMPRRLRQKARGEDDLNETVYIHARSVQ